MEVVKHGEKRFYNYVCGNCGCEIKLSEKEVNENTEKSVWYNEAVSFFLITVLAAGLIT